MRQNSKTLNCNGYLKTLTIDNNQQFSSVLYKPLWWSTEKSTSLSDCILILKHRQWFSKKRVNSKHMSHIHV